MRRAVARRYPASLRTVANRRPARCRRTGRPVLDVAAEPGLAVERRPADARGSTPLLGPGEPAAICTSAGRRSRPPGSSGTRADAAPCSIHAGASPGDWVASRSGDILAAFVGQPLRVSGQALGRRVARRGTRPAPRCRERVEIPFVGVRRSLCLRPRRARPAPSARLTVAGRKPPSTRAGDPVRPCDHAVVGHRRPPADRPSARPAPSTVSGAATTASTTSRRVTSQLWASVASMPGSGAGGRGAPPPRGRNALVPRGPSSQRPGIRMMSMLALRRSIATAGPRPRTVQACPASPASVEGGASTMTRDHADRRRPRACLPAAPHDG